MRSKKPLSIENVIQSLLAEKLTPGISLLVARRDEILFSGCYGRRALQPREEPIKSGTIYDLASLTKPLLTALLAVYLSTRGEIGLDDGVDRFAPGSGHSFTIRQLLTHTSGLPDWYPYYLYHPSGPRTLEELLHVPNHTKPGRRVLYSCVGYMILCRILEKAAAMPLERLAREVLFQPLDLSNTFLHVPPDRRGETAPTERGNLHEKRMGLRFDRRTAALFPWRSGIIRGETHDVNSFHQGGFAGNAGLFSDTRDVWRLACEFFPETAAVLPGRVLKLFWTNATPAFRTHRSIGFKLNSSRVTSGGRALESEAIGHNGFTGTSLWLEPRSGRIWILLTNRIHPRVSNRGFDGVRRRLHRLLKSALALP